MKSKSIYGLLAVCALLAFLVLFGAKTASYLRKNNTQSTSARILRISAIYQYPLGDDRVLMGASHNVFVGKVMSQIGTRIEELSPGKTLPVSQFSIEPILNIKGNLQGIVTVEQTGGYQDGVLFAAEDSNTFGPTNKPGAGYLMQTGSTYLLTTRYESNGIYYLWAFPTASKLISEDSSLSDSQLQSLAANDSRVQQLEAAYPNEILDAEDVRNNNTLNSYASTHLPPPPPPPSAPTSTPPLPPPPPAPAATSTPTFTSSSTNPDSALNTPSSTDSSTLIDSSSPDSTATSSNQ